MKTSHTLFENNLTQKWTEKVMGDNRKIHAWNVNRALYRHHKRPIYAKQNMHVAKVR